MHIYRFMLILKLHRCLCYFFCSFCGFFVHFKCQCFMHLLLVLLWRCLVRPCECIFCSFVTLVCFAVGVRYTDEFAVCLVGPCARLMKFCVCMSHANVLIFLVVVVHECLLHERVHTLVSACALAHALVLAHNFATCT